MPDRSTPSIAPRRRDFLRKTTVPFIPLTPFFVTTSGCDSSTSENDTRFDSSPESRNEDQSYTPRFFNTHEWISLQAVCNCLIPHDENGPGAVELRVPEFIDRKLDSPYGAGMDWYLQPPFQTGSAELGYQQAYTPSELFRQGLNALNDYCFQQHKLSFAELEVAVQEQIMQALEQGKISLHKVSPSAFFNLLLNSTLEGYFADPRHGGNLHMAAWKMIGFPGARADYSQFINQQGKPYPYGPVSISGENA